MKSIGDLATKLRGVQATIFDGRNVRPCTIDMAKSAETNTDITWIDIRLDSLNDPGAEPFFEAVGLNSQIVHEELRGPLNINFQISDNGVYGVAWLDGGPNNTPVQAAFAWDPKRLITVRLGGDNAVALVQKQISQRSALLTAEPSAVLGVVLQLMLATVQRSLAALSVEVGMLDDQILNANSPQKSQTVKLANYRQSFSPLALLFPSYVVNVKAALIDPSVLPNMSPQGVTQLQAFASMADSTASILKSLGEAFRNATTDLQAQVSGWQSNRINQLTIVTIIFLPATFLTGYFGMNFAWLDDQTNSLFSYLVLGVGLPILLFAAAGLLLRKAGFSFGGTLTKRRARAHKTKQSRAHAGAGTKPSN